MTPIRIAFIGYSDSIDTYINVLTRYGDEVVVSGVWFPAGEHHPDECPLNEFDSFQSLIDNSDAVIFLGNKVRKRIMSDVIKSCRHIFVESYETLMSADVKAMCELVLEAAIVAQVSFPKMYFWGIEDIVDEYPVIRNIFFNREYLYTQLRQESDLVAEIMSSIMLTGEEVVRANRSFIPLISKRTEMQIVNLDFVTGATSSITGIPVGFFERHDLRIIAERSMAYIDLRKREWHSLKPAKAITGKLIKGLAGLPEVGDLEQFELQDFIHAIKEASDPFVSFKEIASLHHCMKLLDEK
jgi:predicted dehydrogenase